MLTASYRATAGSQHRRILSGTFMLGLAIGGALDVQLTNRFLNKILHASTRATYAGDASTAYHYLDALFLHTLAYCALALIICGIGLLYLALGQAPPASEHPLDAAHAGQQRPFPFPLTAAMVFAASVLGDGLLDRALITWRFAREGFASHVSTDAVLHPFYAYDALYGRLTLATAITLLLFWLVGKGLQRR